MVAATIPTYSKNTRTSLDTKLYLKLDKARELLMIPETASAAIFTCGPTRIAATIAMRLGSIRLRSPA